MPEHRTDLYFECHITIVPIEIAYEEVERPILNRVAHRWGFRPATFLLKKGNQAVPDDFLTTRGTDYQDVYNRMMSCVKELYRYDFTVVRYKIENTLLDVKLNRYVAHTA